MRNGPFVLQRLKFSSQSTWPHSIPSGATQGDQTVGDPLFYTSHRTNTVNGIAIAIVRPQHSSILIKNPKSTNISPETVGIPANIWPSMGPIP